MSPSSNRTRHAGFGRKLSVLGALCSFGTVLGVPMAGALDDGGQHADPVRGIVRAVHVAMISTELQARVTAVGFQEGARFKKGDVLFEFDCRRQHAALASAEAQQLEMSLSADNFKTLQRAQAAGRHEIEVSQARLKKASAEADILRSQLSDCVLEAPFDGRVLQQALRTHETPQPGKPFVGIVAEGDLEIDLIVPSHWTRWLTVGESFTFLVDETGTEQPAQVRRIGAAVDPISQTIKIVAAFVSTDASVLPGMSGTARFAERGNGP